jgi:hypothetical protein
MIKFYTLVQWIIDNNQEISNYYKEPSTRNTKKPNRITARWHRIKKKFDDFISLGLIQELRNETTNKGNEITMYTNTHFGKMISALYYYLAENNEEAITDVYELFKANFSDHPSSVDKFRLLLFQKYQENNLFRFIVQAMAGTLASKNLIFTYKDLLWKSLPIPIVEKEKIELFLKLRAEAFNELRDIEKDMFLYRHKMNIEKMFFENSRHPMGFEEISYQVRGDPLMVALEGFCKKCRLYVPVAVNTLEYVYRSYNLEPILIKCVICGTPRSMSILSHTGF